jgi:AcrR family transcriptional regulator
MRQAEMKEARMMVDTNLLKSKMAERVLSVSDVAARIGLDKATLYRRLADGESFTVGEVQRIKDVLSLTMDEAVSIFFTSNVA